MDAYSQENVTDAKIYTEIRTLVNKHRKDTTELNHIGGLIDKIDNINFKLYDDETILDIISNEWIHTNATDSLGKHFLKLDSVEFSYKKKHIDLILEKGFNKNNKTRLYNAPIFFMYKTLLFLNICALKDLTQMKG
jgi:hypothetical protein